MGVCVCVYQHFYMEEVKNREADLTDKTTKQTSTHLGFVQELISLTVGRNFSVRNTNFRSIRINMIIKKKKKKKKKAGY